MRASTSPRGGQNSSRVEIKFYGAFVLNYRVPLHASSTIAPYPTHWLISTQLSTRAEAAERSFSSSAGASVSASTNMGFSMRNERGSSARITS